MFFILPLSILTLVILNHYYVDLLETSKDNLFLRGKALAIHLENAIKDRIYPSKSSPDWLDFSRTQKNLDHISPSLRLEWDEEKNLTFVYERSYQGYWETWKFKGDFLIDKILSSDLTSPHESIVLLNIDGKSGMSDRIEDSFQITEQTLQRIQISHSSNLYHLLTKSGEGDFVIAVPLPSLPLELILIHPYSSIYSRILSQIWKYSVAFTILLIFITFVSYSLSRNFSEKRKEEAKLKSLMENLPLGVCLLDDKFQVQVQNKIWMDFIENDPELWDQIQKEAEFRVHASKSPNQSYVWELKKDKTWEITLSSYSEEENYVEGYVFILRDLSAKKLLFENELELAKKIQEEYLPDSTNELPGIQFQSFYKPYFQVGGDYYDLIQLRENQSLFVMADVAGHGIQAAMMMTVIRVLFLQISSTFNQPEEIIQAMNQAVIDSLPSGKKIVPFHFLILDTLNHSFTYTNAGHPGMIYFKNKKDTNYQIYEKLNPALGLPFPYPKNVKVIHENYQAGARFLLYTDGLLDVMDGSDTFGLERILEFAIQNNHLNPKEFSNKLYLRILEFSKGNEFPDDITWFVIDCD